MTTKPGSPQGVPAHDDHTDASFRRALPKTVNAAGIATQTTPPAGGNAGAAPRERPILFSAPMVRALLDGSKTQTRRVAKGDFKQYEEGWSMNGQDPRSFREDWCPYGGEGDRLWVKETWNTSVQWAHVKPTDIHGGVPIFFGADYDDAGLKACAPWRPSLFLRRWMSRLLLGIVEVRSERLRAISEADAIAEGIEKVEHAGQVFWRNYLFETAHPRKGVAVTDHQHRIRGYGCPIKSYRSLWDSINAKPKEVFGEGGEVTHYVSYPWAGKKEVRQHRGKPWHVLPNPWVWVIDFRRVEK